MEEGCIMDENMKRKTYTLDKHLGIKLHHGLNTKENN
jgi:hypothetical protein